LNKKILIVDDEIAIVDLLKHNLEKEGYSTIEANNGEDAYNIAINEKPDLILLDVMLPIMDGFTVCKKIRQTLNIPIIMLTAKEDEIDKIVGLELGADDYITKPFSVRELIARIKANLRKVNSDFKEEGIKKENSPNISIGVLNLDLEKYEARVRGKVVELTLREFELLKFLVIQQGQVFSREYLLEKVWGYEYFGDIRTVDVTIRRIREKIEEDPSEPELLVTKRGIGYYFDGDVKK
jgi:Response regulators consisting of a CheY-like receiver domain and a winged-helix DNA-binding domain